SLSAKHERYHARDTIRIVGTRAVAGAMLFLSAALVGHSRMAYAGGCLSDVDDLIVEYGFAITPSDIEMPRASKTGAGAANQGVAHATAESRPEAGNLLTPQQRKQLARALQDARDADALRDEARCMELLGQARSIIPPHP